MLPLSWHMPLGGFIKIKKPFINLKKPFIKGVSSKPDLAKNI